MSDATAPERSALLRLLRLFLMERRLVATAIALQLMQVLTYIPFTAGIQYLVDEIIMKERGVWWLAAYALANLLLWPIHMVFTVGAFRCVQKLVRSCIARLRLMVVDKLQSLSMHFYTSRGAGALANQVTVDVGKVEGFLNYVGNNFVVAGSIGVVTLIYLLFINPLLALVALLAVPVQIIVIRLMNRRLKILNKEVQQAGQAFAATMVEFVGGMRMTKSFGNEDLVARDMAGRVEAMRSTGFAASMTLRWMNMYLQMAWQYTPVLVWCIGGWLYLRGETTIGELTAFIGMLGFVQAGFLAWFGAYEQWSPAAPGMNAILGILDSDELEDYLHQPAEVPLQGGVRLRGVTFTYPGNERPALRDIHLEIPAGQRIGLVGQTGAGKSTFVDLILAFNRPQQGEITWDGLGLERIGRRQLRRQAAIMGQDAFLWNASVRENIRMGRPGASDAEVRTAAASAQALEFIERLERGFDTEVGERGARLSGGQRQRIALARIFLRDPRIIVLDEPTSALDLETEARLQADLDQLCAGRTTCIVAHRLSTVRQVDRILVFDDGRIVEDGAPGALLADPSSRFARLWRLQELGPAAVEGLGP